MWTYKKPTEPGLYYVNLGDVVTEESLSVIHFVIIDGALVDDCGFPVRQYNTHYKFMFIDHEALNKIGNDDESD